MSIGIRHIVCNRMKLQITPGEQKNLSHPVDDQQRVRANKTKLYFCECDQNYRKRNKSGERWQSIYETNANKNTNVNILRVFFFYSVHSA